MHLLTAPHGTCYLWDSTLVWGFASADLTIGLSYLFISSAIAIFTINPPIPFTPKAQAIGYLFASFVFLCGCTHFTSVIEIWHPFYYSHLILSAGTAAVSLVTACLFLPVVAEGMAFAEDSIRDPLTGLYNRRFAEHELQREKERCDRYKQQMAIILLDVDWFKQVNDQFGHAYGDKVLQRVAVALQENFRPYDVVCRFAGDEILAVIPETSADVAVVRAESMLEAIRELKLQSPKSPTGLLTCTIGVAVYPSNGNSIKAVIDAADKALYQAKKEGRDRVVIAPLEAI